MMMDEGSALMEMLFDKDIWFHETDCSWENEMSRYRQAKGGTAIFRYLTNSMHPEDIILLQKYFAGEVTMEELDELYLMAFGLRWDM